MPVHFSRFQLMRGQQRTSDFNGVDNALSYFRKQLSFIENQSRVPAPMRSLAVDCRHPPSGCGQEPLARHEALSQPGQKAISCVDGVDSDEVQK